MNSNIISTLFFFVIFSILSCNDTGHERKEKAPFIVSSNNTHTISISPLERLVYHDTLKLFVQFANCGEWGGHHEYINVFKDSLNKTKATLTIDSVNCERYSEDQTFSKTRNIFIKAEKYINEYDEERISKFLQYLVECNLHEQGFSNAGDYYEVKNTDSSLYISFWNSANIYETGYFYMRNDIFDNILKK